ncbi:hypothetical protein LX73_0468 [Fodinibius salinus]|uniref:Uncharacterized protein n=1 Tax=Fodinibius salinus TaxID=860790 RepID=A0A5D3YNA5_9BACT|nr:hypothetical protein [Fodinibius salinus]TYP95172.1 hypothetical protein LX73_0468 [Fodinibius salinus]
MIKKILILLLIGGGIYYYWTTRPITHGPGVVAPDEPVQETVFNTKDLNIGDIEIDAKASINMEARVLAMTQYDDKYSDLTTTDIVFGWGPMSNERHLDKVMVRQSERSYHWDMGRPPIKPEKMWGYAENMHIIAPTKKIRDKIKTLRIGHIVEIDGYLVNAKFPGGWNLKSSLKRGDQGEKASELVWIKSLTIL